MSDHDEKITLRQLLDYSREAVNWVAGRDESELESDRLLYLAVTRLLTIIGEAATRVSADRRKELSQIPWRQMIGLRNILIHVYDMVDNPTLWIILTRDLPLLVDQLEPLVPPEETE